jgi:hypothetical protein
MGTRHKYLTKLHINGSGKELFNELKEKGYVDYSYDTQSEHVRLGGVYKAGKGTSICTCWVVSYQYYDWRGAKKGKKYNSKMFKLTKEGEEYIKELLIDQGLSGDF